MPLLAVASFIRRWRGRVGAGVAEVVLLRELGVWVEGVVWLRQLLVGWTAAVDGSGRTYYWNSAVALTPGS